VRILFLSQRVPYPPNRGDKIATWNIIRHLRRDHDVQIVAFEHGAAERRSSEELRSMGFEVHTVPYRHSLQLAWALPLLLTKRSLTTGVYGSSALQAVVDRLAPACDLAYAYSSSMGAFLLPHPSLPRVMAFMELDSDKWRQYAEVRPFPWSWVYRREARTLLTLERELAYASTQNVLCTPLEQRIFDEAFPEAPSTVLRNGVALEHFHPRDNAPEPGHIVFTGMMDYYPNADGCAFFARDVLPAVRERHPEAHFSIVGARPSRAVLALGELDGVRVTGFVDDTRDWLRRAAIAVAPLRIARGIQNKVLEALAMGLPVVGSTPATQGVEGTPGQDFLLADGAQATIAAVCSLLGDPDEAARLGRTGRTLVETSYDWEKLLKHLDQILAEALEREPTPPPPTTEDRC